VIKLSIATCVKNRFSYFQQMVRFIDEADQRVIRERSSGLVHMWHDPARAAKDKYYRGGIR